MRPSARLVLRLTLSIVAFGSTSAFAQDAGGPPIPKPTAEHKILAADVGNWEASVKSYMGPPDAPPTTTKGVEVNTMLAGGLWMTSKFTSDFGGIPFEGHGQFGYDAEKKKYIGTWIDSMSPSIVLLEGTYDAKTKTMTFVGEGVDPATKSKYVQKMVTTTNEDGTRHFTLYMKSQMTGDKEVKALEIDYKKRRFSRRDGPDDSPAGSKP